ncbi:14021_t:CDS:1 [Funneliformis caledonium]|uniref:14021_t:CDS:1 n=1 Tax=Funneliformis caledonium TaxID=1117310 RepID=A0A9N9DLN2_9GLOM|nr:14021_t:CDS:1 [Funneliformis caledonium]
MSEFYEIIGSLELEEKEIDKLQIYLTNSFTKIISFNRKKVSDIELLYERERSKRSRLEAILDAKTYNLSSLWYIYKTTHCQSLWFEPARKSISFAILPTGDKENAYFRKEILDGDNYVKAVRYKITTRYGHTLFIIQIQK